MAMQADLFGEAEGWRVTGGKHAIQIKSGNEYICLFPHRPIGGEKDWTGLADALARAAKFALIESLKAKLAGDAAEVSES